MDENWLKSHENFWYELWIIGYDKDQKEINYSKLIFKSNHKKEVISKAEELHNDPSSIVKELPNNIKFITIRVDVVAKRERGVIDDEPFLEIIDQVYEKVIRVKK